MELSSGGRWRVSPSFKMMTENEDFSQMVRELAQFAVSRYVNNYSARYKDTNFLPLSEVHFMRISAGSSTGKSR